jgi:RNA polymerase sigma-70 factor (ECF subfamily)
MPGQSRPLEEPEAFNQLFEHTHTSVFRFIYALHGGPQQEVEDLTAETFMRAWKARRRFQGDRQAATGWLLQIARNLVIDAHRRRQARGEVGFLEDLSQVYVPSNREDEPEVQIIREEQFRILWSQLQALSPEHREMVVLRYILGWQVKRIASHLEMQENTVSVNLRRILKRLQRDWPES